MNAPRLSEDGVVRAISLSLFFLLFPGFYFYHQALAAGLIPAYLGGFFSPICALALVVYMPFYRYFLSSFSCAPEYFSVFLLFIFWCTFLAFLAYSHVPRDYMASALYQYANTLLIWVVLMLLGMSITFEGKWFRYMLILSGVVMSTMLVLYVATTGSLQYYALKIHDVEEGVATYQGFARSACILSFAILAVSRKLSHKLVVSFLSIFVLFVLSARSEFVAYVVSVLALFALTSRSNKGQAIVFMFFVVLLSVAGAVFYDVLSATRQAGLIDLSKDSSWSARSELLSDAIDRINASPVMGQFGRHFELIGSGGYAHNMLSVWDSFGLIGFILFFILNVFPLYDSTRRIFIIGKIDSFIVFYFLVSFSCIFLLLLAKPYYWPIPALGWGLYIAAKKMDTRAKVA